MSLFWQNYFFLKFKLSITTVEMIIPPPKIVLIEGYSFKKMIPNIIPNTGCALAIILAVETLKFFRLFTKIVWPIAVVSIPKQRMCGKNFVVLIVSRINMKGVKTIPMNRN